MRGIRHRLANLDALLHAKEEIFASVRDKAPEERQKLRARLEAQIQDELHGTRGQATQLRREKRAFTLACIKSVESLEDIDAPS